MINYLNLNQEKTSCIETYVVQIEIGFDGDDHYNDFNETRTKTNSRKKNMHKLQTGKVAFSVCATQSQLMIHLYILIIVQILFNLLNRGFREEKNYEIRNRNERWHCIPEVFLEITLLGEFSSKGGIRKSLKRPFLGNIKFNNSFSYSKMTKLFVDRFSCLHNCRWR